MPPIGGITTRAGCSEHTIDVSAHLHNYPDYHRLHGTKLHVTLTEPQVAKHRG